MRSSFAIAAIFLVTGCGIAPSNQPPAGTEVASVEQPLTLSVATTSPAVLPPELKFSRASIEEIQAGEKTATVRLGVRSFPSGLIKAVSNASEPVVLTHVATRTKKMSDLTEADAKVNGSDSLDELKADLDRDYPGISPDDVVTVITFRPAPADAAK